METKKELESLGHQLHERLHAIVKKKDWLGFARQVHPMELAEFKDLFLTVLDAAANDILAKHICDQIELSLTRQEIVDSGAFEVFAGYLNAFVFPQVPIDEGESSAGEPQIDDTLSEIDFVYHGTIVEDDQTLHVVYQTFMWPQLATFVRFNDEWKVSFRGEIAKFSMQIREVASRMETGDSKRYYQAVMDSQLEALRIIGHIVYEEGFAAVVTEMKTTLNQMYGVFSLNQDDPAFGALGDISRLEQALRTKYDDSADANKSMIKSIMELEEDQA
jgi:hypothetical protein